MSKTEIHQRFVASDAGVPHNRKPKLKFGGNAMKKVLILTSSPHAAGNSNAMAAAFEAAA